MRFRRFPSPRLASAAHLTPSLASSCSANAPAAEQLSFRKMCAWKAYQHCASYDSMVAEWMWTQVGNGAPAPEMSVPMKLESALRYGENPHQSAAFYSDLSLGEFNKGGVARSVQHHGKEMSYNNYLDADAAYQCACDFAEPTCVIVKHTNPCGVATRGDLLEAYRLAVRADPVSAFGGIVAFNQVVDEELAKEIREFRSPTDNETRMFYEIVIAPGYTEKGLEVLKGKSKQLRILEAPLRAPSGRSLRQVAGGWLQQDADSLQPEQIEFKSVGSVQPTAQQLEDIKFAWRQGALLTCRTIRGRRQSCDVFVPTGCRVVKHVKSNAITVAKGKKLLGMGSGQPNRVNSTRIALEKAGNEVEGSVLASGEQGFPSSSLSCVLVCRTFPPVPPCRCLLPLCMGRLGGDRLQGRGQGHRPPGGLDPRPGHDRRLQQVRRRPAGHGCSALQALGHLSGRAPCNTP